METTFAASYPMAQCIEPADIVANISDGLVIISADRVVEFANRNFFEMFQASPDETVGRRIDQFGCEQWDQPLLHQVVDQVISQDEPPGPVEVVRRFGGGRVLRICAHQVTGRSKGSKRAMLTITDVTAVHNLEAERERRWRLAQDVVDTVRDPLLVLDGRLTILAASRSFYTAFGVSEAETVGSPLPALNKGQWNIPGLIEALARVIADRSTVDDFEAALDLPRLGRRTILLNARNIHRESGETQAVLLGMEDVTELRQREQEREQMLSETRILLQELNHRVMNSLAMIGAVITLEGRSVTDGDYRAAFDRMRARVQAIGTLYKNLSPHRTVDRVRADLYLTAIVHDLLEAAAGRLPQVEARMSITPAPLSTDAAVPLGLIVNELVTNSVKYAFAGRKSGTIGVELAEKEAYLVLTVWDDGAGIDAAARIDSGLGRKLIAGFVQQLRGCLKSKSGEQGTRITLTFPGEFRGRE